MTLSVLKITDGTTTVNLLDTVSGIILSDWRPTIPLPKGDGVWQSSPLADGRRLSMQKFDNAIETFELKAQGDEQDEVIMSLRQLTNILTKAVQYWTTEWQVEPVYIIARGAQETNYRYALIYDWRLDGLSNPFSQPFFGAGSNCVSVMDSLTMVLERGHWLSTVPGTGDCLHISSLQECPGNSVEVSTHYHLVANTDDASGIGVNGNITSDSLAYNSIAVGENEDGTESWGGLRFPAVTIPVGATILNAYIRVNAAKQYTGDTLILSICNESASSPSYGNTFSAGTSMIDMYDQDEFVLWTITEFNIATTYDSPDISTIIQSRIDRADWASGDSLLLFLKYMLALSDNEIDFSSIDGAGAANAATLYVTYATTSDFGQESTCGNVYVPNKHVRAQITNAYWYDDSAASFSATNLIGETTPFDLLPAVPAVNDCLYVGINTGTYSGDVFSNLVFDIIQGVDITGVDLEYCTNSVGPVFSSYRVDDQTLETASGITVMKFTQPSDFVTCAINGVTGYWIRLIVTSVGAAPDSPQQQNRKIYTPIAPYFDVASGEVSGDIPALIKAVVANLSGLYTTLHIGSRTLERGEEFSAYMNVVNAQNNGVSCSVSASATTDDMDAPAGDVYQLAIVGASALTQRLSFSVDSEIANQYIGRFNAYLRVKVTVGNAEDIRFQLSVRTSSDSDTYVTDLCSPESTTGYTLVNMGAIVIGNRKSVARTLYFNVSIGVLTETDASVTFRVSDLILIPADEFFYTIQPTVTALSFSNIALDGISVPGYRNAYSIGGMLEVPDEGSASNLLLISSKDPQIQVGSKQRIWMVNERFGSYSYPLSLSSISAIKQERYLAFRGSA